MWKADVLEFAVEKGHSNMMELLLDSGASSSSALELAVENGRTDVVRIMLRRLWIHHLENGYKVNGIMKSKTPSMRQFSTAMLMLSRLF